MSFMLNVTNKPSRLSVVMLSVVKLSVVMLSVIMLSVVASIWTSLTFQSKARVLKSGVAQL